MNREHPVVLIEGQIGVGKTTLGEILQEEFSLPLYRELGNPHTLTLLDKFYADKKRWSFTLQIHFLNERFRMIKEIFKNNGGILDRSIFGDRIFASMLHDSNEMTDEEFSTYSTLLDNMLEHVQKPQLLIYLDCTTETALARIQKRDRGLESSISADYLDKLNKKYISWYNDYNLSPKLFVNANDLDIFDKSSKKQLLDKISQYLAPVTT
ncbi:deoxynucleoside kinase [Spirochaeta cellobiosiphila]|uniref:deoxynucleoside kinase n=1 Tax=Spirochaeta cellobiosiphila TaxID=504483 RepID=UPI000405C686|nr:deoxynucleoside kinase [Spirochaeta cellobiosiphila]